MEGGEGKGSGERKGGARCACVCGVRWREVARLDDRVGVGAWADDVCVWTGVGAECGGAGAMLTKLTVHSTRAGNGERDRRRGRRGWGRGSEQSERDEKEKSSGDEGGGWVKGRGRG